jgi:hypothetical protein
MVGEDPGFAEALGRRKALQVIDETAGLLVEGGMLVIGANHSFAVSPEMLQWGEVRTALGRSHRSRMPSSSASDCEECAVWLEFSSRSSATGQAR